MVNVGLWPARVRSLAGVGLDFSLLSHFQRVVDLDAEVSNRALQFGVAEEQLHRPQVFGASVDQRCLRAAHRVCSVRCVIKTDRGDPAMYDTRVLPRRYVRRPANPAWKETHPKMRA